MPRLLPRRLRLLGLVRARACAAARPPCARRAVRRSHRRAAARRARALPRRYYPDFYAPLGSDLIDLESYSIELHMGTPFKPLAQLLSVLPPQSSALVPPPYRELMLSPTSPIFDAYPADFVLDLNGKRAEWEAIALLPFIDERRLLSAVEAIDGSLSEVERARNVLGEDIYYRPQGAGAGAAAA